MPRSKKSSFDKSTRSLSVSDFYSDFHSPETLHAFIIRSPSPVGKIKEITINDLPEGYNFFTAKDIPGNKSVSINDTEINIFAYDKVNYTGEPLGILVGPDEIIAKQLLEKVSIDFKVQSLESALENVIKNETKKASLNNDKNTDFSNLVEKLNEMPSLDTVVDKSHIENNQDIVIADRLVSTGLFSSLSEDEADQQLFTSDDYISENTWAYTLNAPTWIETSGAYSYFEDDILHVYTPTKWTFLVMNSISKVLNIPFENIVVHKTQISGIFSKGIWRSAIIAVQVALAAYFTKRPVKLEYSQEEQFLYMAPGVKADFKIKTAMNQEGIIKANKILIDIDVGSANPFSQEIIDRLIIASCNYYKTDNLYIFAKAHLSKNPPTSISIKNVCSQAFFAIENQMQTLSQISYFSPSEIRQLNVNTENSNFPFKINITDYEEVFNNTIKISDFNRKYVCFAMDVKKRIEQDSSSFFALPLRGIGIASAYNNSGYYGASSFSYNQKIKVTLNTDNKVIIRAIKPSIEIQEIWKKTASEILEIDVENIQIDSTFNIDEIPESPEDSISTIGNTNEVIKKCCTDIQKRRFHEPLPLEAQKALTIKREWDKDSFTGNPFGTKSFAVVAVEVELDSYTFNEKIKGIWITIDCGELYDENAARKKIHLEIQQVLSILVSERTIPCDNITINFIESGNKSGQIGELIQHTLPAAFSAALSQALATQMTELPCTENYIYQLLKEREVRNITKDINSEKENPENEEIKSSQQTED